MRRRYSQAVLKGSRRPKLERENSGRLKGKEQKSQKPDPKSPRELKERRTKLRRERVQKKREEAKEAGIKLCTRCLKFMDPLVEGPIRTVHKKCSEQRKNQKARKR